MRDNKGFTLVELLAVIAILAIVALITTPAITSVINNSRKSAAEDKAWGAMDAVKMQYTTDVSTGAGSTGFDYGDLPLEFSFDNNGKVQVKSTAITGDTPKPVTVTMNGERPVGGTVTLDPSGAVTCSNLKFVKNGKYTCTSSDGNKMECKKTS